LAHKIKTTSGMTLRLTLLEWLALRKLVNLGYDQTLKVETDEARDYLFDDPKIRKAADRLVGKL